MTYKERIGDLTKHIPTSLVDFDQPREQARVPTQATTNFITNKEQGDWAENLIFRAINESSKNYVAVKYGKSDSNVAGDEGWDEFYKEFQHELDTIGKRPDLLIFHKRDFDAQLGTDVSKLPHDTITEYVKKAIGGIEVRSSAFLIDRYESAMQLRTRKFTEVAMKHKNLILSEFKDLLENSVRHKYIAVLESITEETLSITDFKVPGWSSTERLVDLNNHFKTLKGAIKEIQKRDF